MLYGLDNEQGASGAVAPAPAPPPPTFILALWPSLAVLLLSRSNTKLRRRLQIEWACIAAAELGL